MTRQLAESVYVAGRFFAAGAVPDEEYAALITNPSAWGEPAPAAAPRIGRAAVVEPTTTPAADPDPVGDPGDPAGDVDESGDLFDPSAEGNGLDEVNNHLAVSDEDEVRRVLALEADGKKRKGILNGPYAPDDED